MNGSLVFILHTHLPWVLNHGSWPHGSHWLFEAAAECYIPLLNEFNALMDEGITPGVTLSMTPVVVEQMADSAFGQLFNDYLEERIDAAVRDRTYFSERSSEQEYIRLAEYWEGWYTDRHRDFNERYGGNLVRAFSELCDRGGIALQTCAATHGYFPLLGRDQSISAQLSVGVDSHRRHFGNPPRGVWMPECGYRPAYYWQTPVANNWVEGGWRAGVEQIIARHALEYTVVDSHLTRGGHPLGIYAPRFDMFSREIASGGRFLPLDDSRSAHEVYKICSNGTMEAGTTAIFTRDAETTLRVWSGLYGYPGDPQYLEFHKRHHNSGHRYWRVTGTGVDLADKPAWNPDIVAERVAEQAEHFVACVESEMADYRARTGREGTLAAPFDTELFGHWWFEGPRFLAEVIRRVHHSTTVRTRTAPDELDYKNPAVVIEIPEGSWGEGGGHHVWLNEQTSWTWPHIYEVETRLLDLVGHTDPVDYRELRLLKQLARESLLLQSSDWQFLITTGSASDYASRRFMEHYDNSILLISLIERLRSGIPLSLAELEKGFVLESINRPFPSLQLDAWRGM